MPCEVLLVRNRSTSSGGVQIVEVAAGSLGRLAFADRLVWLLDSGQMRECYCTPGAAATMVERCNS